MTKRGRYVKKARCSFLFFFFSPIEWQIDDTVPSLSGNYYYSVVGRALVLGNAARRKRDEEAKEKKKEETMTREGSVTEEEEEEEKEKRRGTNLESERCSFQSKKRARDKNKVVLPRSLTT